MLDIVSRSYGTFKKSRLVWSPKEQNVSVINDLLCIYIYI